MIPAHLKCLKKDYLLFYYKSKNKLESNTQHFIANTLNIEIFDLHRQINSSHRILLHTSYVLSNGLSAYIWNALFKRHTNSFNNFRKRVSERYQNKFDGLYNKKKSG